MSLLIDSVFRLAQIPLSCPHYSCITRRAKDVDVNSKTKTQAPIQCLAIDATGLKVYGEGEWKVKKRGTDGNAECGENYILQWIRARMKLSPQS